MHLVKLCESPSKAFWHKLRCTFSILPSLAEGRTIWDPSFESWVSQFVFEIWVLGPGGPEMMLRVCISKNYPMNFQERRKSFWNSKHMQKLATCRLHMRMCICVYMWYICFSIYYIYPVYACFFLQMYTVPYFDWHIVTELASIARWSNQLRGHTERHTDTLEDTFV